MTLTRLPTLVTLFLRPVICASFLMAVPSAQATSLQADREPCPNSNFTCITLKAPLDHFGPIGGETTDVVFGILPARDKARRKGMFVTAVGGPGASGLHSADSYVETFDDSIRDAFDIVFFDQRGIGQSGGFQCADAVARYYKSDGRAKTPQQEKAMTEAARTFAQECAAQLPKDKLRFYGTRQAVEDLEAFRKLMGEERLWLYGESYGTQFAQWYAAAHPDHVAGLVLDGVVDLTLSGPQFLRDSTQAFSDVLQTTLQACNGDKACRRDMGRDAVRAYDQLAQQLGRAPAKFDFPLPSGRSARREFSLSDLETAAASFLYAEGERMLLQRAVAAAANGEFVPLARLFYNALGLDPETLAAIPDPGYSDAAYYAVTCNDYEYFEGAPDQRAQRFLKFGDRVDREVPRLNSVFYGDLPCAFWPKGGPPPIYEPGFATLIPTLVLGATADPATPVGQGRNVFDRLNNAYLITTQGGPHVIFGRGNACPDGIVTALLVEGKQPGLAETVCKGAVAGAYVPLPPANARAFKDALEAMASAENEIVYSPEYYYWDQARPMSIGCNMGGAASFELDRGATRFTLQGCAGSYDPGADRFTLTVAVAGNQAGSLDYVRKGAAYRVTGTLNGKPVKFKR
jgi:pimeloyl-ACP methyl ester carboxylesterase